MADRKTPFARFFSSVEGHVVSRYGSGTPLGVENVPFRNNAPIGATLGGEGYEWDCEVITAITEQEARAYRSEYDGHVSRKELVERTEEDYLAFLAKEKARAEAYEKALKEASKIEASDLADQGVTPVATKKGKAADKG